MKPATVRSYRRPVVNIDLYQRLLTRLLTKGVPKPVAHEVALLLEFAYTGQ